MTIHRHSELVADPRRLVVPGPLSLACEIFASRPDSVVDVTYLLAGENRYRFELADGSLARRIVDRDNPVGLDPTRFTREVRVSTTDEGSEPLFLFIAATLVEQGSGSTVRTAAAIMPVASP
ncbi:MAG: hypothetical protein R3195_17245 [Gemmatimonadota bacterium]|nr:hypothetical protein [Gemmatimonadota bacterium]